jgi:hypothetical protein
VTSQPQPSKATTISASWLDYRQSRVPLFAFAPPKKSELTCYAIYALLIFVFNSNLTQNMRLRIMRTQHNDKFRTTLSQTEINHESIIRI